MKLILRCSVAVSAVLSLLAVACGGSVETSPDPGSATGAPPARSTSPSSDTSTEAEQPTNTRPVAACHARPADGVQGLDSCAVARASLTVEVAGIAWLDPTLAWKKGGRARLVVRYQNRSETVAIQYPGLTLASSDPRAQTDTEAHGDPFVHPDLYALSACTVYDSRDHGFTLLSAVPSGTTLTFTLTPAVATGNGIGSCNDTLPKTVVSFTVP